MCCRWQSRPSLLIGYQGGKALKRLPADFNFERKSVLLFASVSTGSGDFVPKSGVAAQGGAFIYAPVRWWSTNPRFAKLLPRHAITASNFPAASNALALPVGNLIFAATPTERITHYTLQAKSCAKGIPFGNPILSERVATLPPKCKISGCNLLQNHSRIDRLFCCTPPRFLYPLYEYISQNMLNTGWNKTLKMIYYT